MSKRFFLITALVIILATATSWCSFHKFYLTVTQVSYSEKDKALQLTSRIFIDDFNALLKERYGVEARLGSQDENPIAVDLVAKYFSEKLVIWLDQTKVPFTVLGYKKDNDVLVYFLEAKAPQFMKAQQLEIFNNFLIDLYETQQNVVHLKLRGEKKSFLLMKDKPSGVLNFQ